VVEAIQERLTIALRVAEDTPADRQATSSTPLGLANVLLLGVAVR
jgi:hypothetical protein